jgi:hypothetical protein
MSKKLDKQTQRLATIKNIQLATGQQQEAQPQLLLADVRSIAAHATRKEFLNQDGSEFD